LLVDKRAIAFLGDSGFGKSTLAAAFVRSGYPLITDDLLVFDEAPHGFRVSHGLPHLKLFPETCSRLGGDAGEGVRMNPLTEKLIIPLERSQFHEGSAPIRCLYVLAPPSSRAIHQPSIEIAPFSSQEAFVEVCKSGFNSYMSKPARLNRQFTFATTVASRVPIKLLSFANGIESLDSVRDAVLGDVGLDG